MSPPLASADPAFVASAYVPESLGSPIGDDDKIYFFFSETGQEFEFFENTIVSRVARVCKVSGRAQGHPPKVHPHLSPSRTSPQGVAAQNQSVAPLPSHPCLESGVSGLWTVCPGAELASPCYTAVLFCFLFLFGFSRQSFSM